MLIELIEDLQLLLAVESIRRRARVGVRHGEDPHRDALLRRDQTTAFVRELSEPLFHDLFVEDTVQLRHHRLRKVAVSTAACCRCKCYQWGRLFPDPSGHGDGARGTRHDLADLGEQAGGWAPVSSNQESSAGLRV